MDYSCAATTYRLVIQPFKTFWAFEKAKSATRDGERNAENFTENVLASFSVQTEPYIE